LTEGRREEREEKRREQGPGMHHYGMTQSGNEITIKILVQIFCFTHAEIRLSGIKIHHLGGI